LLISEDRYHYGVHKNGSSHGYHFDDHKSPNISKISMDSLLKIEGVFQINIYSLLSKYASTLISTQTEDTKGMLQY